MNNQIKHDNKTINKVCAILYQNNINFIRLPYDRVIVVELYEPREFKLMQKLLPPSGNSSIGKVLTHKPPIVPKYRPYNTNKSYKILLQCI